MYVFFSYQEAIGKLGLKTQKQQQESWFVVFANYWSVNTSTMPNYKLSMWTEHRVN